MSELVGRKIRLLYYNLHESTFKVEYETPNGTKRKWVPEESIPQSAAERYHLNVEMKLRKYSALVAERSSAAETMEKPTGNEASPQAQGPGRPRTDGVVESPVAISNPVTVDTLEEAEEPPPLGDLGIHGVQSIIGYKLTESGESYRVLWATGDRSWVPLASLPTRLVESYREEHAIGFRTTTQAVVKANTVSCPNHGGEAGEVVEKASNTETGAGATVGHPDGVPTDVTANVSIVADKFENGARQYCLRWDGPDRDCTWEPAHRISKSVLNAYHDRSSAAAQQIRAAGSDINEVKTIAGAVDVNIDPACAGEKRATRRARSPVSQEGPPKEATPPPKRRGPGRPRKDEPVTPAVAEQSPNAKTDAQDGAAGPGPRAPKEQDVESALRIVGCREVDKTTHYDIVWKGGEKTTVPAHCLPPNLVKAYHELPSVSNSSKRESLRSAENPRPEKRVTRRARSPVSQDGPPNDETTPSKARGPGRPRKEITPTPSSTGPSRSKGSGSKGERAPIEHGQEGVYTLERLVRCRTKKNGARVFEVKWEGYDTTTWEPAENINEAEIEQFDANYPKKKRGRAS